MVEYSPVHTHDPIVNSLEEITEEILSHANSVDAFPHSFEWGTSTCGHDPYGMELWYRRLVMSDDGWEFPIYVEGPHLWAIHSDVRQHKKIVPEYIIENVGWSKDLTPDNYSCSNVFEALKTGKISGEHIKQLLQKNSFNPFSLFQK